MPPSIPTIPRDSSPRRSALRVGVALGVAIVSVVAIVVVVFYAASPPADISPTPDTSTNTAKMNSSGRQNGSSSRDTTPATAKSGRAATLSDRRDADWRKIDNPGGDGWETEVFHSRAKKQLGKLAELLASGDAVAAEKLSPLLASDFSCSALRPETLQPAFNESGLYVQRGASSDAKAFRTVDGLREALHRLTSTMNQSTTRRIKFKIFRVTEDADQVTTRQYVSIVAPTPAGIVEQHATWQIHWAKAIASRCSTPSFAF